MSTSASPFRQGEIWRVRIAWPNGAVHIFGKFTSEQEATAWITAHSWLTMSELEKGQGKVANAN